MNLEPETKKEKITQLEKSVSEERDMWNNKILTEIKKIKNIEQLPEVQAHMLSMRQQLTHEISVFRIQLQKIESTISLKKKKELNFLTTKSNVLYNSYNEKTIMINAKLLYETTQLSIINSHIDFLESSRNTLDKAGFSIKNRMELYLKEGI